MVVGEDVFCGIEVDVTLEGFITYWLGSMGLDLGGGIRPRAPTLQRSMDPEPLVGCLEYF